VRESSGLRETVGVFDRVSTEGLTSTDNETETETLRSAVPLIVVVWDRVTLLLPRDEENVGEGSALIVILTERERVSDDSVEWVCTVRLRVGEADLDWEKLRSRVGEPAECVADICMENVATLGDNDRDMDSVDDGEGDGETVRLGDSVTIDVKEGVKDPVGLLEPVTSELSDMGDGDTEYVGVGVNVVVDECSVDGDALLVGDMDCVSDGVEDGGDLDGDGCVRDRDSSIDSVSVVVGESDELGVTECVGLAVMSSESERAVGENESESEAEEEMSRDTLEDLVKLCDCDGESDNDLVDVASSLGDEVTDHCDVLDGRVKDTEGSGEGLIVVV
jgi:hypothetical protein